MSGCKTTTKNSTPYLRRLSSSTKRNHARATPSTALPPQLLPQTTPAPGDPCTSHAQPPETTPATSSPPPLGSRFAPPKTDTEIKQAVRDSKPKATQKDTKYCLHLWDEWRAYRESTTQVNIPFLLQMTDTELSHWLTRFVLEVRKKNGDLYPPNTLHHIVAGLQRHLRWSGRPIDLFKDQQFYDFQSALDAELKRIAGKGIGAKKRQAEVITEEEEQRLWEKGLLGEDTPQQLLDTVIFYNGLYFALRSGREHRQLRHTPCQIELVERDGERPHLVYRENISKNHPGGLRGRNLSPKVVVHHANLDRPQYCFVRLFRKYRDLCPQDAPPDAFYLQPARNPTSTCWYSNRPLGHNPLSKTVGRLCKDAGVEGFKTNHSLRATATSRLYRAGVDEQLVMERTGHRSVEGVRSYKRTSDTQREALSDILNIRKVARVADNTYQHTAHQQPEQHPPAAAPPSFVQAMAATQHSQQLHGLSFPSATFNNCTFNFHISSSHK